MDFIILHDPSFRIIPQFDCTNEECRESMTLCRRDDFRASERDARARSTRDTGGPREKEEKAGKNEEREKERVRGREVHVARSNGKEGGPRERVRMVMVAAVETAEEEGSECSRVRNSDPSRIFI